MLAMAWMYFYPKAGWVMVGVAVLICVGRVLTGVHHIRDVVGGAALGFALGFAGNKVGLFRPEDRFVLSKVMLYITMQ